MIRVADLVTRASSLTGFAPETICGRTQTRPVCRLRFAIAHVATRHKRTSTQIGRILQRDASTISNARGRAREMMDGDPGFAALCDLLERP
jgi:hypothetical protein